MEIIVGADHAGYALKEQAVKWLREWGYSVEDVGAYGVNAADDYPDVAFTVAERVAVNPAARRGVLACGSGQGVCIAANKVRGIHAVVVREPEEARLSREHGDTNVLCLSSWQSSPDQLKAALRVWLEVSFSGAERHVRRLGKIAAYEAAHWKD